MLLRRVHAEDRGCVLAILGGAGLPTEGVVEHFETFIVAESESRVAGVAGLEMYGADALLRSVVVVPEARGTGLGAALTRRALSEATSGNVRNVYLLTTTADAFFPRFGFERIGWEFVPAAVRESREFNGACPSNAVAMRASLKPPKESSA
jgi:amino-acid N-acetyltransferase